MATKKVGTVIKEAREKAGMSQEQLARKSSGVSLAEVRAVEAGETDLTQAKLKILAKTLGVTQATLLNAPKNVTAKKTSSTTAKKPASTSTTAKKPASTSTTAKKPASTSTTAKKPASTSTSAKKPSGTTGTAKKTSTPKTPANANTSMKVTATEKKLVEAYRAASADAKKAATKILKGERDDLLDTINGKNSVSNTVSGILENAIGSLLGK